MILVNKTSNIIISENVIVADTFFKRLKGLMFTKELSNKDAMHIIPCNGIHTFFMKYSIDVLYLDINQNIIHMDENMQPGLVGKLFRNSASVIELPSGKIKDFDLKLGQAVNFLNK